jgi:hypothetical protein
MKDGLSGQHFPDDTVIAAIRKWLASAGAAYGLLFIADKSA